MAGTPVSQTMPSPVRVLHVDDDPSFAETASAFFDRDERVTAETVTDGPAGLEALESGDYDYLVADSLSLPDGDPFVTATAGRSETPVVLLTGQTPDDLPPAVADRAAAYVRKGSGDSLRTVAAAIEFLGAVGPETGAGDGLWRQIGRHDWAGEEAFVVTLYEALASASEAVGPDAPPLQDHVDVGALGRLLRSGSPAHVAARFVVGDRDVAAGADGSIWLRAPV